MEEQTHNSPATDSARHQAEERMGNVYGGRKSIWKMSHIAPVHRALPNSHWDERGLESLEQRYRLIAARRVAPVQLTLPLG